MTTSQGSLSSATPELTDQYGRRRLSWTTPNPESPQLNGNETHAAESEKVTLTKAEPRPSSPLWEWTVEILWLVLSIVSLVVMSILLSFEDGKTWESWNFYLSLNTVVSILGTLSRISLASAVGSCLAQEKWNWYRKRQDHLFMFD